LYPAIKEQMYINNITGGNMNTAVYTPEWVREDFVDFVAEKFHPTVYIAPKP